MGGIVGKFFHEFGLTIVAAVLISMFVSFTLDPMLSSIWHDPQAERGHGAFGADGRRTLYDRTIGRVTGLFDRLTLRLSAWYQSILAWSLGHRLATLGIALRHLRRQLLRHPDPRRRVRAQGRLLRDPGQLLHAGRLVARGDRDARAPGRRRAARDARGALHRDDDQQRPGGRQDLRRDLRAPGRPQGPRAQRHRDGGAAARAAGAHSRHHRHQHRPDRPRRRQEPAVLDPGHRPRRARAAVADDHRQAGSGSPAWSTSTPRSSPTSRRWRSRSGATPPSDAGLNVNMLANTLRTLVAGTTGRQLARARRRELRRQRAARAGEPLRHRRPAAPADQRRARRRRLAARGAAVAGGRRGAVDRPEPDQPARPEPRDQRRRQRLRPQLRRRLGRHDARCSTGSAGRPATATRSAARPRT